MSMIEAFFEVIEDKDCPFYDLNDEFRYSANALHMPVGKPACTILTDDIKNKIRDTDDFQPDKPDTDTFSCSGCTGKIQLRYEKVAEYIFEIEDPHENAKDNIARLLSTFSFFKTLKQNEVRYLVPGLTRGNISVLCVFHLQVLSPIASMCSSPRLFMRPQRLHSFMPLMRLSTSDTLSSRTFPSP